MASQRTFRIIDSLDARLVKEAKRQGRSVSNLIVWAIVNELANAEPRRVRESFPSFTPPLKETYSAVEGTPLPKIAPRGWAK